MTAIISKSLRDELMQSVKEKYPACAETIKNMARERYKNATEQELEDHIIRLYGKIIKD